VVLKEGSAVRKEKRRGDENKRRRGGISEQG
jgi:hypothetical protein